LLLLRKVGTAYLIGSKGIGDFLETGDANPSLVLESPFLRDLDFLLLFFANPLSLSDYFFPF